MQNAEAVGLKKDHISISKFDDANDWDFVVVSCHISEMVKDAPLNIAGRWETYEQQNGSFHMFRKGY